MARPAFDIVDSAATLPAENGDRVAHLCDYLISTNKISSGGLERAAQVASESDERVETVLTKLGLVSERELTDALVALFGLPIASAGAYPQTPVLADLLGAEFLRDMRLIPLAGDEDRIVVAMINPLDEYAISATRFAVERAVEVRVAYPSEFESAFKRLYGDEAAGAERDTEWASGGLSDDIDRLSDLASEAPVVRLVNTLIARAVEARASDIHIEPMESDLCIRYRIDGVLQRMESPPKSQASAIISRVKIMAKLNIAERRMAQDGRITLAVRGTDIDFRVATTPTSHGESVVLRILDRGHLTLDYTALGFEDYLIEALNRLTQKPHGIMLVTGPTGSGKTTTLYTALLGLNTSERKILTIEDPIEYQLEGVNQVQIKPQIGLTFASALRSFLRHDPDIMMIGEIRDLETAQIAVQAALTGHLILSTLHTNDAPSAITRLVDMGLEDYLLTSTLNGVVAQRLVRKLCPHCRAETDASPELIQRLGLADLIGDGRPSIFRAVGCSQCRDTGYRSRTSIAEVLAMTDTLRQAVLKNVDSVELHGLAREAGMEPMRTHGFRKALAGETTIDEVLRVTLENV